MTQTMLVIDTETGGLDPLRHSILSLGAVIWEDGRLVDSIEIFVREIECATDPEAIAINKMSLAWLNEHGVSPVVAVKQLEAFLALHFGTKKVPLVGHNVHFDIGFVQRLYRLGGGAYERRYSHRVLDTASVLALLILARRLPPAVASSDGAFEYFGIRGRERHTALGDALATAELLNALLTLARTA